MSHIAIIIGSTRPNRFSIQPAELLHKLAADHPEHVYTLVDLKELALPLLDEPMPPSMLDRTYSDEAVQKWSKIVDEADGFIFVTPEYNHGVPAALKNATDVLAPEWAYKPVAFVSYGVEGGVRSVAHMRSSLVWLNMFPIKDTLMLINHWQFMDDKGRYQPTEQHIEAAHRVLDRIGFWGDYLKDARARLTEKPAS